MYKRLEIWKESVELIKIIYSINELLPKSKYMKKPKIML